MNGTHIMADTKYSYEVYGEENNGKDIDILMLTYNHADYIAQAIESVLMQKTKYSYRIIIGEDRSTDSTRDVVQEYYRKYPQKITLLLWKHNVGGLINFIRLLAYADAEFIANLEGDDYWTDPLKLEKQISFLKNNRDFIGTCHNVRCVDAQGKLLHKDFSRYPIRDEHIYGVENARRFELASQTASIVYRNFWGNWDETQIKHFFQCKGNGDLKISILLGLNGKVLFMKDIMADHRRIFDGDSWTAKTYNKNLYWISYQSNKDIKKYVRENIDEEMRLTKEVYLLRSLMQFMETLKLRDLVVFLKIKILG